MHPESMSGHPTSLCGVVTHFSCHSRCIFMLHVALHFPISSQQERIMNRCFKKEIPTGSNWDVRKRLCLRLLRLHSCKEGSHIAVQRQLHQEKKTSVTRLNKSLDKQETDHSVRRIHYKFRPRRNFILETSAGEADDLAADSKGMYSGNRLQYMRFYSTPLRVVLCCVGWYCFSFGKLLRSNTSYTDERSFPRRRRHAQPSIKQIEWHLILCRGALDSDSGGRILEVWFRYLL